MHSLSETVYLRQAKTMNTSILTRNVIMNYNSFLISMNKPLAPMAVLWLRSITGTHALNRKQKGLKKEKGEGERDKH